MLYKDICEVYNLLESTQSKIAKSAILSALYSRTPEEDLYDITLLSMGRVFPSSSEAETGIAAQLMAKAISRAYGISTSEIESEWKSLGDLGLVAESLSSKKTQRSLFSQPLTVQKVFSNIRKLPELTGAKSQERKIELIAELLHSASSREARYAVRTILGDMRIGVAEGLVRDAIADAFFAKVYWKALLSQKKKEIANDLEALEGKSIIIDESIIAFLEKIFSDAYDLMKEKNNLKIISAEEIEKIKTLWKKQAKIDMIIIAGAETGNSLKSRIIDAVEYAYELTNDYGKVAEIASKEGEGGLLSVAVEVGKPIHSMEAIKEPDIESAMKDAGLPAIVEYKYDGYKIQIHRSGESVRLFTRRLEEVTKAFPEVVKYAKENINAKRFVVEGECVAYDPKSLKPQPFQFLSRRIKRKYDISKAAKEIPVVIKLFDVLVLGDELLMKRPLAYRRERLEEIVHQVPNRVELSDMLLTNSVSEATEFYTGALKEGHEGVMVKNKDAVYKPGRREGYQYKVKPTLESLDLVIVRAVWGEGRRSKWLGSFYLACRDPDTGELLEVGKMATGLTDAQLEEFTKMLTPLIVSEHGREVDLKPAFVVEVDYEEIQKSPTYASGYALRFPRLSGLRSDKPVEEASDVQTVERIYEMQRGRK